jgi:DNA repair protein RecO (recombination protein O)
MAPVKSSAIVLRTYMLGETSRVVVCYTRDYGKVRLVAKGVRKGGGPLGAALEPMLVSGVVFYLRPGRDLSLVSQAEVERQWPELRRDVVRMAYAGATVELLDAMVTEHEPDARLFDLTEATLAFIARAPERALGGAFWWFELRLAAILGYEPNLSMCAECGSEASAIGAFDAREGGILCESCAARAGRLSDAARAAAAVLRALASGEPASEPPGAGLAEAERVAVAVADEINTVLRDFLEEHAGRRIRLKSLDFLAQVRRSEPRTDKPE